MRILLAPSSYAPNLGGIEHLTGALAHELRAQQHVVAVLSNRWPDWLPEREEQDGLPVYRISMPAPSARPHVMLAYPHRVRTVRERIARVLDEFQPDLVHPVGASWQAVHAAQVVRGRSLPVVVNLQGETAMDDARIYQRSVLLRRAFRGLVRDAAVVVACSRWTLDHARGLSRGLANGRVIPNGVDFEDFAGLGTPPPGRRVLAYGRLVRNKGFDLLVEAARGAGWQLAIGGAGPEELSLKASARSAGVDVDWLGRLDRTSVVRELARASAVAVPSRQEPFGIVALEAMAAGRPVAVSSIGGMPEFVRGGVIVDPNDRAGLRGAVDRCLAQPELGRLGRDAAAAFAWPLIAGQWVKLYSEAVNRS